MEKVSQFHQSTNKIASFTTCLFLIWQILAKPIYLVKLDVSFIFYFRFYWHTGVCYLSPPLGGPHRLHAGLWAHTFNWRILRRMFDIRRTGTGNLNEPSRSWLRCTLTLGSDPRTAYKVSADVEKQPQNAESDTDFLKVTLDAQQPVWSIKPIPAQ